MVPRGIPSTFLLVILTTKLLIGRKWATFGQCNRFTNVLDQCRQEPGDKSPWQEDNPWWYQFCVTYTVILGSIGKIFVGSIGSVVSWCSIIKSCQRKVLLYECLGPTKTWTSRANANSIRILDHFSNDWDCSGLGVENIRFCEWQMATKSLMSTISQCRRLWFSWDWIEKQNYQYATFLSESQDEMLTSQRCREDNGLFLLLLVDTGKVA